jgi:hypothetical protein
LTSSSANFRRCALLLKGIQATIGEWDRRERIVPLARRSAWRPVQCC